ncbi:uncharacterized protein LOC124345136 isoform X1 [Daphnia pulicaria]|uniref:uncharacterized protein LOC124345136 isoform X1 n=1 Tax=Daphnia pulicaria TaxID=35523 RepID=UPI001EECF1BF|nr:uncharacterized protein LOC124345136 isoform X1 [Daphnia pulicaria]XP_046654234.1 uncharacterized protein LOC124345136 isoform X1 [Daphnia pulicaria]XP_046654235.1 uncharacterized protein LOC124345136 isoform X1 [Daphnia pulicaria]
MGWYFEIILGILVISCTSNVWANSECNPAECRHLRERLEKLETVVRGLISIVANKKTEEELTEILALSASLDSSKNSTVRSVEADLKQNQNAILYLRGAVKCSLATLLDINHAENNYINPSGKIEATLDENNSLQIEWTPLSVDCIKFSSGFWIRVYDSSPKQPSTGENYLAIPQKCLKRFNATFSIVLSSSASKFSGKTCHFELKEVLVQCHMYTIEVVPNYQSFKGKPLFAEIVVPPANDNSTISMESLLSFEADSTSLTLKWKDNSECAPELTALHLEIFPEGEESAENTSVFRQIRSFYHGEAEETNIFSLFFSKIDMYPRRFVPLDPCRSYQIQITSEYYDTWTKAPTVWEIFTVDREFTQINPAVENNQHDCPSDHFYCDDECQPSRWICDGIQHCEYVGDDELYCNTECRNGFRCGRQCIPSALVCDGEYDCIDRSDENDSCDYRSHQHERCSQMTTSSGHLNSQMIMCHRDNVHLVFKKVVSISVKKNHTIWLSFKRYVNLRNQSLKIYDGPYLTSPLLLSHNGTTKPLSMRSSSNKLYIEFTATHCHRNFMIDIDYTSMDMMSMKLDPFVPGCGGYVYDIGVVSSPTSLSDINNLTECIWFVEADQSDKGIFLKRNRSTNITTSDGQEQLIMTVYDGWNSTGQVLYDGKVSSSHSTSEILYSISHKVMIKFTRPTSYTSANTAHWDVATISMGKEEVMGTTGKIESPNYPAAYPNSYDYRWNIITSPGTKIQLLFAFFKTQEMFDFVLVYDGSTVNSRLLLEKSGYESMPFTITSSSNELLVRFTSDDDVTFPGFLAVHSAV